MPTSVIFQKLENKLNSLATQPDARARQGNTDEIIKFIKAFDLSKKNERDDRTSVLTLVIDRLSAPEHSENLLAILDVMITAIKELPKDQQVTVYAAQRKGHNSLKWAASVEDRRVLAMMLDPIAELDPIQILLILTGMEDQSALGKTVHRYSEKARENLTDNVAYLPEDARRKLLTARDASKEEWNILAYAALNKDPELIKFALHFLDDACSAGPGFLSTPTTSPQVNASTFLYMLSQSSLVTQLLQSPNLDLMTLKIMLTAREKGGQNAVAFALTEYPALLCKLLPLVERLNPDDQRTVLRQLTSDAMKQLVKHASCSENMKTVLTSLLGGPSSPQKMFQPLDTASASDSADSTPVPPSSPYDLRSPTPT